MVCVLIGASVAGSAPALALSQRGHSVAFSFASKGESAGRLVRPAGVAVTEADGDVYVVDAGNNRIERYSSTGEFLTAWGWGVSDGKSEFEVCAVGCQAGIAGEGAGQLDAAEAIAIDNSRSSDDPSRGDVYVLADTAGPNNVIEKFGPDGEVLGRLRFASESPGLLGGVAVDASGKVWVSDLGSSPEELVSFSDANENEVLGSIALGLGCAETRGLAVAPNAEAFYASHQLEAFRGSLSCPEVPPSAKAPAVIAELSGAGESQREALDFEDTSGVAVDSASTAGTPLGEAARGDVYVDNLGSVAEFAPSGSLVERFGAEELSEGAGLTVDSQTGDVLVVDSKADRVDVFEPEQPGKPAVDSLSFEDLSPTSTRLKAQVDPHGSDTRYYFEYGTADCRATPAACSVVPAPPGEDLGSDFGARTTSAIAGNLTPGTTYFFRVVAHNSQGEGEGSQTLQTFTTLPAAADVLADDRAWELVSPPEKHGALIYPIGGTTENGGPASGVIETAGNGGAVTYAANAPLGEGIGGNRALEATQAISVRGSAGWSTQDIATPSDQAQGLQPGAAQEYRAFSSDLSLGLAEPFGPYRLTGNHMQEPPLVVGGQSEERGLYVRQNASCQGTPTSCFAPLVMPAEDTTGAQFGGELEFAGASPNLQHVVFTSNVALSSAAPSAPGLYEWSAGKPPNEALQLVSVLPGNTKAAPFEPEPQLGDFDPGVASARNAVSADGSRVFWSAVSEERGEEVTNLYMRDTISGQTLRVNAAQGIREASAEERASEEVHFRGASADGSRVFFTDTFPLTAESKLRPGEGGPADLYVCEVSQGAAGPQCDLRDLTVDPGHDMGESADVVGTILGVSEDGSNVYFAANGVLSAQARAAGAVPGQCAPPNDSQAASATASCNLYLERYDQEVGAWEAPRFIARLSQQDQPDWGGSGSFSLAELTSRVSPNGRYVAFMSREALTGYDNVEQNPAAQGARDEEVYLYDADEDRLVCASCNPSGAQPQGVLDHEASGEGKGLVVDRPGVWKENEEEEHGGQRRALDHWLGGSVPGWTPVEEATALYQSRYLSDQGRLFFDSPDQLVPEAKNAKEDVYEYEPEGLGSCGRSPGCVSLISSGESQRESAFLDASENGNDVFFLTSQPLTTADHDNAYDVYDAHVCSEASPCSSPPTGEATGCEALETCRPLPASLQSFPGPSGSAALIGPPNPTKVQTPAVTAVHRPLSRAQKLADALRTCRKRYRASKKRTSCERRARKQYAPHKPAAPGKGKKPNGGKK